MFIITEKTQLFKRYLDMGLTELATKCSSPFSRPAFASTRLTKRCQKVSLSVNILAINWSIFKQMQTLHNVTNFSLKHGFKICHLFYVIAFGLSRLETGHFRSLLPFKFSSLHLTFPDWSQENAYNRQKASTNVSSTSSRFNRMQGQSPFERTEH